jgi:hypothetical protein
MVRRCCGFLAGCFLVVLGSATSGFAQGGRAEINGTITDQGKAVLPGVNVTATNEANGLERVVVSGPDGRYIFPGTYTVKAERWIRAEWRFATASTASTRRSSTDDSSTRVRLRVTRQASSSRFTT